MQPRLTERAQRQLEDSFKNDIEAHDFLDLIDAEFRSDPTSTQCFDKSLVERVRFCVAKQKANPERG